MGGREGENVLLCVCVCVCVCFFSVCCLLLIFFSLAPPLYLSLSHALWNRRILKQGREDNVGFKGVVAFAPYDWGLNDK